MSFIYISESASFPHERTKHSIAPRALPRVRQEAHLDVTAANERGNGAVDGFAGAVVCEEVRGRDGWQELLLSAD